MEFHISPSVNFGHSYNGETYLWTDKGIYALSPVEKFILQLVNDGVSGIDDIVMKTIDKFKIIGQYDATKELIEKALVFSDFYTTDISTKKIKISGSIYKCFPRILHVELTNSCNLNCSHCYKRANLSSALFLEYEDVFNKIVLPYKNKIHTLHYTGGEPTLHPDFDKIIRSSFDNEYELELTTNGILISVYDKETLRLISSIDASIYGLSNTEYENNTGISYGFDKYVSSCEYMSENKIYYVISLVVNKENIGVIEDYIKYAISVKAPCFRLGPPSLGGKLLDNNTSNDKWNINKSDISYAYRKMRELQKKYGSLIDIKIWDRKNYRKYPVTSSKALKCSAGRDSWWVNERLMFRPCALLPDEYLLINYDEWNSVVQNISTIDWDSSMTRLKDYCLAKSINITDICEIFK